MALGKSEYLIEIKQVGGGEVEVTMNGVATSLKQVNTEIKKIKANSSGASSGFKKVGDAAKGTTKANQDLISSSGLAGATLVETGRLISDLPFGITAVTNNLSQLSTLFITLGAKTGGATNAFSLLIKQLKGPLGFILVFQVVISLLQVFQKEITGVLTGQEKLTKANKELAKSYNELLAAIQEDNEAIKQQDEAIEETIDKLKGFRGMIELLAAGRTRESMDKFSQGIFDRFMLVKEAVEETTGVILDFGDPNIMKIIKDLPNISEKTARAIVDAKNQLEAARIKGDLTTVEALEEEMRIYVMEQKARAASEEEYLRSSEYIKLQAQIEKAKMDARQKAIDDSFKERGEQVNKEIEKERALLRARAVQERLDPVELATANLNIYIKMQELLGIKEKEYIQSPEYLDLQTEIAKAQIEARKQAVANALKEEGFQGLGVLFTAEETELQKEARKELKKGNKDRAKDLTDFLGGEQKRLNAIQKNTATTIELSDREQRIKTKHLKMVGKELGKAQDAFAEGTAANKALGVANATIDTYAAADAIMNPVKGGGLPFPLNIIAAAAVVTAGLANVKSILSVKVPGGKGGGGSVPSATTASTALQAPDFNVVGATAQSQLAETVAGTQSRPLRAFVVGKDITTQQELDRNTRRTASFGG